ncbi:SDR family oxidoreductase [Nonomuraea dietziae]|uniref:NAD(P)-dependent dehydrogenase (Short-subunit alcohol dehydrogenase family) n=1 Tax=Nonomuraea dietziae TaxID=65515 RepID=A0A7W5VH59_9ACTN|nr:SDR family oxidoreductase [Nonomuraea dietziae]MBB3731350.1 NAD(P)-dependent dehydrogenase (short-subunit alcohol dehydrogenase family) [Nonomuraea dietziae]
MIAFDYTGKVVLVTGGTKGLGRGIARAFLSAGATVIVCARTPPDAPVTAPPYPRAPAPASDGRTGVARFVRADVRDPEDLERLFAGLDRLDVVVNNAGGAPYAMVAGTSPRLHARVIELNLIAPLLVAQRAHPLLAATQGTVIMIGSTSGTRPSPGTSAYGAAKAGLHHLAACLAAEWAPDVRVNTVVVGLAETENAAEHYGGRSELMSATIPAGRMAGPSDVGEVCLWLAGSGYVTGAQILVHGGGETPAWKWVASDGISR